MAIGNAYSTFSFGFASTDAYRVATAARGAEETVSEAVRQAAFDQKYIIGSTITARYKYRVGEDGSFIPVSTQVTAEQPEDGRKGGGYERQSRRSSKDDERRPTFADYARPRATLSPSDEMELFAAFTNPATPFGIPLRTQYTAGGYAQPILLPAQATDENGESIEAELLAPDGSEGMPQGFIANRAQSAVAELYERNRDLIYSNYSSAGFAA